MLCRQTQCTIRYLVINERRFQHELFRNGELDEPEFHKLEEKSNSTYKKVTRTPGTALKIPDMATLFNETPLFSEYAVRLQSLLHHIRLATYASRHSLTASQSAMDTLNRVAKLQVFNEGQVLFEYGASVNGMYVVCWWPEVSGEHPLTGRTLDSYLVQRGTVEILGAHPKLGERQQVSLGRAGAGHTLGVVDFFQVRACVVAPSTCPADVCGVLVFHWLQNHRWVSARATTHAQVVYIPAPALLALMGAHADFEATVIRRAGTQAPL